MNKTQHDALLAAQELFDKALPKFNWGASALDATAIKLLNEVPGQVRAALAAQEPAPAKPLSDEQILNHIFDDAVTHITSNMVVTPQWALGLVRTAIAEFCKVNGIKAPS